MSADPAAAASAQDGRSSEGGIGEEQEKRATEELVINENLEVEKRPVSDKRLPAEKEQEKRTDSTRGSDLSKNKKLTVEVKSGAEVCY